MVVIKSCDNHAQCTNILILTVPDIFWQKRITNYESGFIMKILYNPLTISKNNFEKYFRIKYLIKHDSVLVELVKSTLWWQIAYNPHFYRRWRKYIDFLLNKIACNMSLLQYMTRIFTIMSVVINFQWWYSYNFTQRKHEISYY